MTPHERNLILKVADEVRAADRTTVDREAERLIRAEVAAQPNAAYILTQRVIVQDLALQQAKAQIEELESRLRQLSPTGGAAEPSGSSTPPASAPPSGSRSGVGDFLKTAAAAAAGTIGGQLIYDGLRHWAAGNGGSGSSFLGGFLPGGSQGQDSDLNFDTANRDPSEFDTNPDEEGQVDEDDVEDTSDEDYGGGGDWDNDDGGSNSGGGDW